VTKYQTLNAGVFPAHSQKTLFFAYINSRIPLTLYRDRNFIVFGICFTITFRFQRLVNVFVNLIYRILFCVNDFIMQEGMFAKCDLCVAIKEEKQKARSVEERESLNDLACRHNELQMCVSL